MSESSKTTSKTMGESGAASCDEPLSLAEKRDKDMSQIQDLVGKILYIEDDRFLARLVRQKLESLGHDVHIVEDGPQGWAMLIKQEFDVILLDYQLPGMDGMALLEKIAESDLDLAVVMVSGASSLHVVVDAMRFGAVDYIVKEVDGSYLDLLAPVVKRVLERRKLIEAKKQAEEALERKKNELEILNQQKNKFFSIVAHDLKSPFSSLLGLTQVFARRAHKMETEQAVELADTIHDSAKRVYAFVENLLSWSRLQMDSVQFKPEKLPLHFIILESLGLAEIAAAEKSISIEYQECDIEIEADIDMINTVLRNILMNAVKFTSDQGKVSIKAFVFYKKSEKFSEGNQEWVNIEIRDNGVGMDKEQLSNLFSLNTQKSTHGTRGEAGTGLGLLLCQDLIAKHLGYIEVESTIGQGSTFRILLPSMLERP